MGAKIDENFVIEMRDAVYRRNDFRIIVTTIVKTDYPNCACRENNIRVRASDSRELQPAIIGALSTFHSSVGV